MHAPILTAHLHTFGRRFLAVRVACGAGWALAAGLLLLLVAAWLDLLWELPPGARIAAGISALLGGLGLLTFACGFAWRDRAPRLLARRLDAVAGTGGEILAGVDLMLEPASAAPLTSGLAALAVERAGQRAGKIEPAQAVPARPLAQSLGSFGGLLAFVGLVALCAPRLVQTQWLRFLDPFGDHPPYSRVKYHVEPGDVRVVYGSGLDVRVTTEGPPIDRLQLVIQGPDGTGEELVPMFPEPGGAWRATVANVTTPGRYFVRSHAGRSQRFRLSVLTVPRFETVRFRITPPAYTNLPAYEGPLPPNGIAGLPGTRVQLWAKSNRPLAGGSLKVPGAAAIDLKPIAPKSPEATATFAIRQPGKLQVTLVDTDKQPSTETFTASITLLTDDRPTVRLVEPQPVSLATPTAVLPVTIVAEDDYGLTRIELYRSLNNSRPLATSVALKTPPPTRWTSTVLLRLEPYGLAPGDEIKLFARAEDNDPAGAKGAESPIAVVRIISQSDFEKLVKARRSMELLQSKYRQAERRLEARKEDADRLRKKLKDKPANAKAARDELAKLAEKMRADAEALARAAKQPLDYDLDKYLSKQLERLSRQLEDAAKEADKLARNMELTPEQLAEALEKLQEKLDRERSELAKEALEPLDHLAQIQPLLEDSSKFVIIYQRQRSLAERLKALKDQEKIDDPKQKGRLKDLQAEQEELRTDLAKLLDDVEDHMAKLPEDPQLDEFKKSIQDFVEAVRNSGAAEAMTEAENGLAALSGKRGHAGAEKAADMLEKLLSRCEGDNGLMAHGRAGLKFKPCLRDGLGDTVDQLLADAGLKPGMGQGAGMGQGSGSGSSARRNTADNVGLYGGLPGLDELSGGGESSGHRPTAPGMARPGGSDRGQDSKTGTTNAQGGSSTAEGTVPTLYRRRVAEYFRRVAEETGGK